MAAAAPFEIVGLTPSGYAGNAGSSVNVRATIRRGTETGDVFVSVFLVTPSRGGSGIYMTPVVATIPRGSDFVDFTLFIDGAVPQDLYDIEFKFTTPVYTRSVHMPAKIDPPGTPRPGEVSVSRTFTVDSISPSSLTLPVGGRATIDINIRREGGFDREIIVDRRAITPSSTGITITPSPVTLRSDQNVAHFEIQLASDMAPGSFDILFGLNGSGEVAREVSIHVEAVAPTRSFTVSRVYPAALEIPAGSDSRLDLEVLRAGEERELRIALVRTEPAERGIRIVPEPVLPGSSVAAFAVVVDPSAVQQTYNLHFTVASPDLTRSFNVPLRVTAPLGAGGVTPTPTFVVDSIVPSLVNIVEGMNANVEIRIRREGGFAGDVRVQYRGVLPPTDGSPRAELTVSPGFWGIAPTQDSARFNIQLGSSAGAGTSASLLFALTSEGITREAIVNIYVISR